MHLSVHPTVFHPRYFISSERFANFIAQLDLRGKRVVDVGTGTGILAIAAAHAGSETLSLPTSTRTQPFQCATTRFATGPGLGSPQSAWICYQVSCQLPTFDVIISNPPKHAKQPRDLADRGWHAGPNHRDVAALFTEAYERLRPSGRLYVMFSSD